MHRLATCQDGASFPPPGVVLKNSQGSDVLRDCDWDYGLAGNASRLVWLAAHFSALKFLKTFRRCTESVWSFWRIIARWFMREKVWRSKVAATSTLQSLPCAQTKAIRHTSLTQAQCACCFFSFSYGFLQTPPLRQHLSVSEAKKKRTDFYYIGFPETLISLKNMLFLDHFFSCNGPVSRCNSSVPKQRWHGRKWEEWNKSRRARKLLVPISVCCSNANGSIKTM